MNQPCIFISCGQFSAEEKQLGKTIAVMAEQITGLPVFLAENVQDLNGLNDNILNALRDCVGLITILHPRGTVVKHDRSTHIRGSVWIEQEIAIAAYIKHVERKSLPVVAFVHREVHREGMRDLLHLNPVPFSHDSEIIAALPKRLREWKRDEKSGIRLELKSIENGRQNEHHIARLIVTLVNDTNKRITEYDASITVPAGILAHWGTVYLDEDKNQQNDPSYRSFKITEAKNGILQPKRSQVLMLLDYCTKCAVVTAGGFAPAVEKAIVSATAWIDGQEYKVHKTLTELAFERV